MPLAFIGQVLFFGAYALGYFLNKTVEHNGWNFVIALGAAIVAVLLIVDNRGVINDRRA